MYTVRYNNYKTSKFVLKFREGPFKRLSKYFKAKYGEESLLDILKGLQGQFYILIATFDESRGSQRAVILADHSVLVYTVYEPKCGRGVAGSQPMSTAVLMEPK
jgi:hypothetical protein